MADLFDRLQATLGEDAYQLERELGGGGMSQVFLATEVELGRKVVIKVLPPDMAAGVNKERFQREIKLAASLQHPHIVQLLTAGSAGDLLWYIMPYIEGESLRVKLAREGELPVEETARLLNEVMDALAYAHESEVVHRDIKPDNVMISRGHALVMDFGVAKAVSASSGGSHSSLTSLGVALGTPAYMSPEQAAADPHVDHRADIYAVGALAYEMLTGRPPFVKQTPQQTLAAHVNEDAEDITVHRKTVPPRIAGLVMKCLAKRPADRWQTASDLRSQLVAAVTPDSGGMTPTETQPVAAYQGATGALKMFVDTPIKLGGVYLGASAFLLLFAYAIVIAFGLPFWVFYGAVGLAGIGFPIVMLTGRRERAVAHAHTTGLHVATPAGLEKHLTWKKALTGGGVAFAGLAIVAGGFMGLRSAGVGPAATLITSGALENREELILADFANRTTDETLGETVTELMRISLAQSNALRLIDPARISESLTRMQRDPNAPVPEEVALEIAERDGFKAVLSGEVAPLGEGYILSARLLGADGAVLTAQQSSASSADQLITAADELAEKLRERIGESLRDIRRTVPLDFITTGSIDALRLHTQAAMAEVAGDDERALDLLEQAVEVDSLFAMAYRKIGTITSNSGTNPRMAIEATTRAYELRDRLTDRERAYAVAAYHSQVTGDAEAGLATFRTLLETYPNDHRALNNSGVLYFMLGDFERTREYWAAGVDSDSTWPIGFRNAAFAHILLGDTARGRETLDAMEARFGRDNPLVTDGRAQAAFSLRDYETAEQNWQAVLDDQSSSPRWQTEMQFRIGDLRFVRGRVREGIPHLSRAVDLYEQRGLLAAALTQSISLARALHATRGATTARAAVTAALERFPLVDMPVANRPYENLATFYAEIGDVAAARQTIAAMEQAGQPVLGDGYSRQHRRARGWLASAEGRHDDAIREYRSASTVYMCHSCRITSLARMFDAAGQPDSALAYWQNYQDLILGPSEVAAAQRAHGLIRLAELHEQAGNRDEAIQYYGDFVDLWADADGELQPQVQDVRRRIARLVGER